MCGVCYFFVLGVNTPISDGRVGWDGDICLFLYFLLVKIQCSGLHLWRCSLPKALVGGWETNGIDRVMHIRDNMCFLLGHKDCFSPGGFTFLNSICPP